MSTACFGTIVLRLRRELRIEPDDDLAEFCAVLPDLVAGEPRSKQRLLDAWQAYIVAPVTESPARTG